ncbi:hypothetical protein TCAL_16338 [Tigriopus californicus]|uniref:Uncharacterized protein n=1 Tax=Tigriopus californicus TaxID=6832 RepID=A0A553N737_TIGCA|nr:hypothetical protein TCAL_16338 [Tigriopus californicus]
MVSDSILGTIILPGEEATNGIPLSGLTSILKNKNNQERARMYEYEWHLPEMTDDKLRCFPQPPLIMQWELVRTANPMLYFPNARTRRGEKIYEFYEVCECEKNNPILGCDTSSPWL